MSVLRIFRDATLDRVLAGDLDNVVAFGGAIAESVPMLPEAIRSN